jgi:hypothetical protein
MNYLLFFERIAIHISFGLDWLGSLDELSSQKNGEFQIKDNQEIAQ